LDQNDVLDVDEAAALLGVSPWTIRDQARLSRLPARKVGREWRFSRQGLLDWLRAGDAGSRPQKDDTA
jgi:excisionase family DNA binding protein